MQEEEVINRMHFLQAKQVFSEMDHKASRLLDDMLKLAGSFVGLASSAGQEIRDDMKERATVFADQMGLVPRQDYEALEQRVTALEAKLAEKPKTSKTTKTTKAKAPAKKKSAAKKTDK